MVDLRRLGCHDEKDFLRARDSDEKPAQFADAAKRARRSQGRLRPLAPGHVYFIHDTERLKIGYSSLLRLRLNSLFRIMGPFYLYGYVPGDLDRERQLQRSFSAYNITGEYFRWCQETATLSDKFIDEFEGEFVRKPYGWSPERW